LDDRHPESTDAWADFLTDLQDRGLACPLLVVSDGARGLIAAVEQVFPAALRQRCLPRLRNVLAKTPAGMQAEIRDGYWAVFDTEDLKTEPGPRLVKQIDDRLSEFIDRYRATYPAAMKILDTDREGLTAYLRFPAEHHQPGSANSRICVTRCSSHPARFGHAPPPPAGPATPPRMSAPSPNLTHKTGTAADPSIYPEPDGGWRSGSGSKQRKGAGWPHSS
jgi:hypothetical protein